MPREYRHIEQYAQEISELQKQGYTPRKRMPAYLINEFVLMGFL